MNILKSILVLVGFITFNHQLAAQLIYDEDVLPYPEIYYQEPTEQQDQFLQDNLEFILRENPYWNDLIDQKRLAVSLVDLRNPENIKYASINGDHMMYAASLPKIAVLLAAMECVKDCTIEYNNRIKADLRSMIAKSNNAATTRMIELLGFDKIAETMESEKYKLYDRNNNGGLWVGKKYAKSGKRNPDPLKGLSHAATVDQVARFYTMLAYGKLVSPEFNAEMMKYLVDPELHHKFVNTLDRIAPYADVYRKSGSWRNYHSDSALVFGPNGRKYVLVVLIEDPSGGAIAVDLVEKAEQALGIVPIASIPTKDNNKATIKKSIN